MMYQAIILAAGYSSRAKTNKMSLKIGELSILQRIVNTFLEVCEEVIVVSGHNHEKVEALVGVLDRVVIVQNKQYDLGMFSSIKAGLEYVKNDCFITPGDYPLIDVETLIKMKETKGAMVVPVYKERKGHPLLIRKELLVKLKKESKSSNLKLFRNKYKLTCLVVKNKGVLMDIDTMEDYEKIMRHLERGK